MIVLYHGDMFYWWRNPRSIPWKQQICNTNSITYIHLEWNQSRLEWN